MGAPTRPPPTTVDTGAALQQLAVTIAALVGDGQAAPRPLPPAQTGSTTLERFRQMKLPTYDGTVDNRMVKKFLDTCEKILGAMEIIDPTTCITMMTFQLEDKASLWWDSIKESKGVVGLSREDFKEKFRNHFLPPSLRDAKMEEFASLIQGNSSVLDYERNFLKLSRYAPKLVSIAHLKCRRFEWGARLFH